MACGCNLTFPLHDVTLKVEVFENSILAIQDEPRCFWPDRTWERRKYVIQTNPYLQLFWSKQGAWINPYGAAKLWYCSFIRASQSRLKLYFRSVTSLNLRLIHWLLAVLRWIEMLLFLIPLYQLVFARGDQNYSGSNWNHSIVEALRSTSCWGPSF